MDKKVLFLLEKYHLAKKGETLIYFKGHFFIDNILYEKDEAVFQLLKMYPKIPKHGNFSYVMVNHNYIKIVSDKTGSSIVYYCINEDRMIISDSVNEILQIGNGLNELSFSNLKELKVAGFVSGGETLVKGVISSQPGEEITINHKTSEVICKDYFQYFSLTQKNRKEQVQIEEHSRLMKNAIYRLKKYCKKRTLVLPLSGGLDSRLVLRELKREGINNIICFTYGKKGNTESEKSRKIAEELNCKWIFIEYNRTKWKETFNTKEFQNYLFSLSNYHVLPHIQDYIAVKEMITNDMIPKDSIFIPGHTGDFTSGGHILPIFQEKNIEETELIDLIIKKHYRVNKFSSLPKKDRHNIKEKIIKSIVPLLKLKVNPAFIYEYFDWKERQQKHVLHSLNIYEYFGYEWYIPLWDSDLIEFWREVPLNQKLGKTLYKEYLIKTDYQNIFSDIKKKKDVSIIKKTFTKNFFLYNFLLVYRKYNRERYLINKYIFDYYTHPLDWYGMFSYVQVLKIFKFQNIYSILVRFYIKKTTKIFNEKDFIY